LIVDDEAPTTRRGRFVDSRTPRDRLTAAVVVLSFSTLVLFFLVLRLQNSVDDSRDVTYVGRGVNCQVATALGVDPIPEGCLHPEVRRYYDPTVKPVAGADSEGQKRNVRLLCSIIHDRGIVEPICSTLEPPSGTTTTTGG
jgi:hypothetical protein